MVINIHHVEAVRLHPLDRVRGEKACPDHDRRTLTITSEGKAITINLYSAPGPSALWEGLESALRVIEER